MQLADLRHRIDDRTALTRALQDVLGPDRVFTHPADLIAYEYDGSVLAAIPDLAVHPVSTEEVVGVVKTAGCMLQIASGIRASGLRMHVHHLIDPLDRAYAAAERRA